MENVVVTSKICLQYRRDIVQKYPSNTNPCRHKGAAYAVHGRY